MTCAVCGYVCDVPDCALCRNGFCPKDTPPREDLELGTPPGDFEPKPTRPNDLDFNALTHAADAHAATGVYVRIKFTCAACGARNTFPDFNAIHLAGRCDECGFVSDLRERGGGYQLILTNAPPELLAQIAAEHIAEPPKYASREARG